MQLVGRYKVSSVGVCITPYIFYVATHLLLIPVWGSLEFEGEGPVSTYIRKYPCRLKDDTRFIMVSR